MRQTKIARQVLFLVDRLGRLTADERSTLLRSAEGIARSRRSTVLGVRHLVIAAARWIAPDEFASATEGPGRGSPELAKASGQGAGAGERGGVEDEKARESRGEESELL
jgi:hypothetical protein